MQPNYAQNAHAFEPSIYKSPKLYDIAFSHRDFRAEVHVLTEWYLSITRGAELANVLELAAGPANHAIEYSRRGVRATTIDSCQQMVDYASQKARQHGLLLKTISADMVDFHLNEKFDLALLLTDSASHVHSTRDMIRHLRCVREHLNPHGLYIMELTKSASPNFHTSWSAKENDDELDIEWGRQEDDERRQNISSVKVNVRGTVDGETLDMSHTLTTRRWSQSALEKAIASTGCFDIAGRFGNFFSGSAISDKHSPRLIYVLKSVG